MKIIQPCFYLFCIIVCGCHHTKPYENNLGIEPSLIAQIDTANYTLIHWNDSVINFGKLQIDDSLHFKFHFTNIGKTPLFIIKTKPGCGCTVTKAPTEPIMPGKTNYISATLKGGFHTGEVYKTIAVISNTRNKAVHTLVLHGEIVPSKSNKQ